MHQSNANANTLIEDIRSDNGWRSIRRVIKAMRGELGRPERVALTRFLMGDGSAQRPDYIQRSIRISVASDSSFDNLAEPLALALIERGMFARQFYGSFGQLALEVRDPTSPLLRHNPEILVLAPLTAIWHRLANDGPLNVEAVVEETWSHVTALRPHFGGLVLLQNIAPHETRTHGILDPERDSSYAEFAAAVNLKLSQRCRSTGFAFILDAAMLIARCGSLWPGLHKSYFMAGRPINDDLAKEIAADIAAFCAARKGFARKCLALDLDNTLWGGVVGEDGVNALTIGGSYPGNLYSSLQQQILSLQQRGVVLSILSKNNEPDVWEVFDQRTEMILRKKDISAHRINWQDKATNLCEVAKELNLGIDSFVLLDDNPAERAWIEEALPEVEVCPHGDPLEMLRWLTSTRLFDTLAITQEDALRAQSYAAANERAKLSSESGSVESYLAELGTEITVAVATQAQLARIAQLTQKTNQFNLTTRRYTESDVRDRISSPLWRVVICSCRDRFTDEGIIGTAIIEITGSTWRLDTFLLSCRVLGRAVEKAFLSVIAIQAANENADTLLGEYMPTEKNSQAAGFYASCGFTETHTDPACGIWTLSLPTTFIIAPQWVKILTPITLTNQS